MLSMQESFHVLYLTHISAALSLRTRCSLAVVVPCFVGACIRTSLRTRPPVLGYVKDFNRFFSVKDIYLVREVNHGREKWSSRPK